MRVYVYSLQASLPGDKVPLYYEMCVYITSWIIFEADWRHDYSLL